MKTLFTIILMLLCCLGMTAGAKTASDDGFKDLFNGRDLTGWKVWGDPAGYKVEDRNICIKQL
jgi:hypothetical protein